MRTLESIHQEIEILSEERSELWHRLSAEYDPAIRDEIRRLDGQLDALWDEHRALRARMRFGDREAIVARARVEERLERASSGSMLTATAAARRLEGGSPQWVPASLPGRSSPSASSS